MEIQRLNPGVTIDSEKEVLHSNDLLWRHLKTVPAFRALLRAVEARFYQAISLPEPVLDVGCGDGHFAQMTFAQPLTAGIDPWWGPLHKAQRSGMYCLLTQAMGDRLPYPDDYFASAISNSVLEHIPDIQPVLNETSRVLQPGGRFVITMPSHYFTEYLGGAGLLERAGFQNLAGRYRRFFNSISRHAHTDAPEVWAERMAQAGFRVERWQYYFSREALRALEWGHAQGLPSAVLHFLTGHWILAPWEGNLRHTEQWVRPFYDEEAQADSGAYLLFIARKEANGPIQASLPAARPMTLVELERGDRVQYSGENEELSINSQQSAVNSQQLTVDRQELTSARTQDSGLRTQSVISGGLLLISLLCAVVGQSILSGQPEQPAAGLRWYGYSLATLLLLLWQRRAAPGFVLSSWRLPSLREIPLARWLYLPSLLLGLLAQRAGTAQRPSLALLLWFAAIVLALYAFYPWPGLTLQGLTQRAAARRVSRLRPEGFGSKGFTLVAIATLFIVAFLLRVFNLTTHPFILSGTETSLGLDALAVIQGIFRNPFATGWLSNPTLPLYLLAVPIQVFGRSVLALRLLSPLVGALTVVATYWFGRRLWSREVGLVAAVLLAGAHFHLHYSRLGTTNVWDPFLVLIALGLIGLAWQQGKGNRSLWLLAGVAVGLNAYLFTSSRLLPLMLVALALVTLIFDRDRWRRQGHHILAAAAVALVVALPQLLYYYNEPTIFMQRARDLGILDGHSGWLSQEAARTGLNRSEIFREQFWRAALAFNYSLDNSPSYRPQAPLLGFGPAIFFVIGLAMAVTRLRRYRYSMLVVWVIVTVIFASVLLENPPNSHRLVIVTPALSLLAAIALTEFSRWIMDLIAGREEEKRRLLSHYLLPALLLVAGLFALSDVVFYFGRYQNQHSFADLNTEVADRMAGYLNSLDGEWTAYFYGPPRMYVGFPTIPFLATEFHEGYNLFNATADVDLPPAASTNQVFIYLPEQLHQLADVEARFPSGRLRTVPGSYTDPLFYAYEVGE